MKDIATLALQHEMEIAKDVTNSAGDVIVKAGTKVSDYTIQKLNRHKIMAVTIMEDIDYAVTYFEKIRLSEGFKNFENDYRKYLEEYKKITDDFMNNNSPIPIDSLMNIYHELTSPIKECAKILDYLYNMLPTEDNLTYAHCFNSALIAGVFGQWLCLKPDELEILIQCGFLYDIGKLKLPYELIWKPDKLTPVEFAQIKTHTILGFQILKDQPINENILKATLSHHEKFDGTGYPSRLHDEQINKYARIISIIDAYEAMTSPRTYRQSKHPFQIIEIFENDSFKYDNNILRPILYRLGNHLIGLQVLLSNDIKAEVVLINQARMCRPLLKDSSDTFIDLLNRRDLQIMAIY
ncbi:MAG: HD domain-containing protein [Lachnospiraceae bacterium]|nr:HD domain-containing protein [Lachnospiraceae bacterium]